MTVDISGFGLRVYLIASNTLPTGVSLTQFADDSDPLDVPSLQIADSAMGLNGDLITWSKANPIKATLNLIASGEDDTTMGLIFEANRVGRGKTGARDLITITVIYPDNRFITLTKGVITDGVPGNAVASAGRLKSKPYVLSFENKIGIGA
jgi:tail fiber protein gp32